MSDGVHYKHYTLEARSVETGFAIPIEEGQTRGVPIRAPVMEAGGA